MAEESHTLLMCTEADPLRCHRTLLVSQKLASRGTDIIHLMRDGQQESHEETMEKLLALWKLLPDGRGMTHRQLIKGAVRNQATKMAYRRRAEPSAQRKTPPSGATIAKQGLHETHQAGPNRRETPEPSPHEAGPLAPGAGRRGHAVPVRPTNPLRKRKVRPGSTARPYSPTPAPGWRSFGESTRRPS